VGKSIETRKGSGILTADLTWKDDEDSLSDATPSLVKGYRYLTLELGLEAIY
jgi:hypothetical protein